MEAHRQCCRHTGRTLNGLSSRVESAPVLLRPRKQHGVLARAAAPPAQSEQPQQPVYTQEYDYGVSEYVRPEKKTYADPPITASGTLRPGPEWFPAWMRYRRREDNYVFWQDKFSRNSQDIAYEERRWTVFSTIWYLVMQLRFKAFPPALRYIVYLGWRQVMTWAYELHKKLILWQCVFESDMANKALGIIPTKQAPSTTTASTASPPAGDSTSPQQASSTSGGAAELTSGTQPPSSAGDASVMAVEGQRPPQGPGFSRTMALRRLHWKNSLLAEVLYVINVYKTGRVHMLPPKKKPPQRPTFFWLF